MTQSRLASRLVESLSVAFARRIGQDCDATITSRVRRLMPWIVWLYAPLSTQLLRLRRSEYLLVKGL
jgi:hypothetical protein